MADNSSLNSGINLSAMTDQQLRQTISQLSSGSGAAYVSPIPQPAASQNRIYQKNLQNWSTAAPTPPPRNQASSTRSSRSRTVAARHGSLAPASASQTPAPQVVYQQPQQPPPPTTPTSIISVTKTATVSTYASRLRTGATLLMQPILAPPGASSSSVRTSRRGGVVNYVDPGSGDEMMDSGAIDSEDSDLGRRNANYNYASRSKLAPGMSVFNSSTGATVPGVQYQPPPAPPPLSKEIEKSYLGLVPPERFIKPRAMPQTLHIYPPPSMVAASADIKPSLIPIRVELETDTHRIRDCFVWNLYETLLSPEAFARIFCTDLDLPASTWVDTIANQMKAQIEEWESVASLGLGIDHADSDEECRVILSIDVQISNYHLLDHIEWDLLSPLTPEAFSATLCRDLGLTGEAVPLIAHAIHEELMKHKKDAVEWGFIGDHHHHAAESERRDRSGMSLAKDKTGLGLGWGQRSKPLKSVWRDWAEQEEMKTRFEELSQEEVEKREIEKERASRRLRRETSKFQSSTRYRRYR